MRLSALALLLIGHLAIVAGVVSPLDKVTQDMKAMKETLDSIQASLITSVSLLQGELSKRLISLTYHVISITLVRSSSTNCCELAMQTMVLQ